jgi:uncharacterized protein (DUF342 family)
MSLQKKGITIDGAVGKCQIAANGPASIGTLAGKGEGKVCCQGHFTAHYLNQALIEWRDDVIILQEARNLVLKATSRIAGGKSIALEGG